MLPLLVPIGLGLIGGYLSKDSVETFAGGGLIAPNGKPSNLNPEQYKLVRTPEFKAWFGDWENDPDNASKVVDWNGEPLVVWHGSHNKFTKFLKQTQGAKVERDIIGFYFTDLQDVANTYTYSDDEDKYLGKEYTRQFFLNVRKLKTYDLADKFGEPSVWKDKYDKYIKDAENKYDGVLLKNIIDLLQEYRKGKGWSDYWGNTYVVFEPENIKLANGRNTTFDPKNPDIRYAAGGYIKNIKKLYKEDGGQVYTGDFGEAGQLDWRYNSNDKKLYLIGIENKLSSRTGKIKSKGEASKALEHLFNLYPDIKKIYFEIEGEDDVWKFYKKIGATEEGGFEINKDSYYGELKKQALQKYLKTKYADGGRIERTTYKGYKVGDVIDGNKLDELSGGLVGNDNNKYMLVQKDLSIFPYTRQDLIDLDVDYADEEIWRLESMKDNFEKTPPIPEQGDGMHRIIAAKELGYKTILMWQKI